MKTLMMYSSQSGNTKLIAMAMMRELEDCECISVDEFKEAMLPNFDFFFVGYWIDQGDCDAKTKVILPMLHGKKIALFGTLGAAENTAYYETVKQRVAAHLTDAHIIGHFLCQGSVGDQAIERYQEMLRLHPDDEDRKAQLAAYKKGESHPDQEDILHAVQFARSLAG